MTLTLRAVSLNDLPLTQPITAHFDLQGGTIGRADHNTMALPDPERHISRQQAEISAGRSGYVIKNVGSANPIVVRNQTLAQGESTPLMHSDQVRIGGYLLEVIEDAASEGTTITRGRAAVDAVGVPRPRDASVDLGGPLSSSNPFAELLGEPATPARHAPPPAAGAVSAPARLPDDFDPFAMPAPAAPQPIPTAGGGAFEDLIPSAASASIDDLIGAGGSGRDPLADFMADALPGAGGAPAGAPLSKDPLVLFGGAASRAVPELPPDRTPELRAAFTPPNPVSARRPEPPVLDEAAVVSVPLAGAGAEPAAVDEGDATDPWTAFCQGAGVKLAAPHDASPELMRLAGTLLRAAVEGTVQLMAVRSATRHELHAQVTVIRPRNNNPLKFSPDAQSALEQLLQPPLRGFLPGAAAMTDAMNDLVGHAIGTMAGTRAALEGVLARFSPRELEAKLVGRSVLDSVLPMNRKAKLWELYLQHYEGIRDEAQEDFHALFGKAFLAAYEQQLERLRRDKPAPPR
ncbi:type VI secretion system-associated FHA domain protein TagH [Piscinibacter sp. XHJ-5]|uniref:type VI secretion system-associated FHA domain protein TagH n=1 Tax=Piscinibacter sp. XHJ-5 TaxID=3037797 RepID=UPI00245280B7|nr:type VI secretion system-associated FHA domain protein TagH [Piscinibacter sp. XHJ-5]